MRTVTIHEYLKSFTIGEERILPVVQRLAREWPYYARTRFGYTIEISGDKIRRVK
jgi:hypothetical protein